MRKRGFPLPSSKEGAVKPAAGKGKKAGGQ